MAYSVCTRKLYYWLVQHFAMRAAAHQTSESPYSGDMLIISVRLLLLLRYPRPKLRPSPSILCYATRTRNVAAEASRVEAV